MRRELIITEDGSSSIRLPDWNESYHSKHGAIREAYHVFLKMGLFHYLEKKPSKRNIRILEIGFGTGLNAFITFLEAQKIKPTIDYTTVEAFPVETKEISQLNYVEQLSAENCATVFQEMHHMPWSEFRELQPGFRFKKRLQKFEEIELKNKFDLIYFDAFGAQVQPELWGKNIFEKMYKALRENGILTTYSSKGSVKRIMRELGFEVEILQGPPGKRHMIRASV